MLGTIPLALIDEAGHVIVEKQKVHDRRSPPILALDLLNNELSCRRFDLFVLVHGPVGDRHDRLHGTTVLGEGPDAHADLDANDLDADLERRCKDDVAYALRNVPRDLAA